MVAGAYVNVPEPLSGSQFVDAIIGMRGEMHDARRVLSLRAVTRGLAFGNSLMRAFHQAYAAIGDEPDSIVPQLFFRHGAGPYKVVQARPEGGDEA